MKIWIKLWEFDKILATWGNFENIMKIVNNVFEKCLANIWYILW